MRLLGKIFGNRDDTETAAGEGPDESSPERETIEIEPYEAAGAAEPAAAPEPPRRLTFAPPRSSTSSADAGRQLPSGPVSGGRLSEGSLARRRPADEAEPGSEERPHELTRRRIARPATSAVARSPSPPSIPVDVPEGDDPEEIDVSDQLDDVNDVEADLDASSDLIIDDDEPLGEDDEEETSTSVSVSSDATANALASSPSAASELPLAEVAAAALPRAPEPAALAIDNEPHGSGSISPDTTQPDAEPTRMPTDTKTPKQTLVEAGTEFSGTLKSSCPVVVHGTLDGEIEAPMLSIASTGSIHGNIRVQTLRSSGTLAGSVDAGDVYVSGAVRSKTVIRARRLELALGASGNGHVEVTLKSSEVGQSDATSEPEASTARSVTTTSAAEATDGAAGWSSAAADGSPEPARARAPAKRTMAK